MAKFDAKSFNEKAFGKYMSAIPNVKLNKLRESRAVVGDARLRDTFVNNSQTGTVYAVLPFFGLLSGTPQNYDGVDNVTPGKTDTYEQGVFTYGRMNGWTEADFSYDVTGGTDFMANVRSQINDYWNSVDQDVILAILKGIFSMSATGSVRIHGLPWLWRSLSASPQSAFSVLHCPRLILSGFLTACHGHRPVFSVRQPLSASS